MPPQLPLAIHLSTTESVLKHKYRMLSWLVWWILVSEILSGFGILVLPFLMNEYIYVAGLVLLVLMKLLRRVPLLSLLQKPAMLATSTRSSLFGLSQGPVPEDVCCCAWEATFRVLLSGLAFVSLAIQWDALSSMCAEQPSLREAQESEARGCPLLGCGDVAREALLAAHEADGGEACLLRLRACHCIQRAGIHTNLCYSLGPIFCSTGLDGAPHALLQRTSVVLCAVIAPPVWLCLYLLFVVLKPDEDELKAQVQAEIQRVSRCMQTSGDGCTPKCSSRACILFEIAYLLIDMMLDASCLATLIQSNQYILACCQAAVLSLSLLQQLRVGIVAVASSVRESLRLGYCTDVLLRIVQSERLMESFMSMLIQGTALTSLSSGAATQFNISIFMSLYGIVRAVYREVHLDLGGLDRETGSSCCRDCLSRKSAVSQFRADRQREGSTKPAAALAPSLWRSLYGRAR
ncbi:EIF4E2 [Symbiodinium sp. CCMP2592]|nr:EIF4E2 [Symbiodinium sp. CCMP2592]